MAHTLHVRGCRGAALAYNSPMSARPHMHIALCAFGALVLPGSISAQEESAEAWSDPAPPRVHALEPAPIPAPRAYPELDRVRAARALHADALVEDWPAFLGPRRDAHSLETHLDLSFEREGPPLLWRMQSGEGWSSPIVAEGLLVSDHKQDCVSLLYRSTELARARNHEDALRLALALRSPQTPAAATSGAAALLGAAAALLGWRTR